MASISKVGRTGSRGEPEKTRAAILKSALEEFAQEGVTGARTDEIARRAGVNKALLYYYFKDKEGLYLAVLDEVFSGVRSAVEAALALDLSPRERLAAYVRAHFDYIASNPLYSRIVHAEFLRAGYFRIRNEQSGRDQLQNSCTPLRQPFRRHGIEAGHDFHDRRRRKVKDDDRDNRRNELHRIDRAEIARLRALMQQSR